MALALPGPKPRFPLKGKHISPELGKSLWSSLSMYTRIVCKLPSQSLLLAQDAKFSAKFVQKSLAPQKHKNIFSTPHTVEDCT